VYEFPPFVCEDAAVDVFFLAGRSAARAFLTRGLDWAEADEEGRPRLLLFEMAEWDEEGRLASLEVA
jgi:hypothetical protein